MVFTCANVESILSPLRIERGSQEKGRWLSKEGEKNKKKRSAGYYEGFEMVRRKKDGGRKRA